MKLKQGRGSKADFYGRLLGLGREALAASSTSTSCEIVCREGRTINVDIFVLAAISGLIRDFIRTHVEELDGLCIIWPDLDYEDFADFLRALFTKVRIITYLM